MNVVMEKLSNAPVGCVTVTVSSQLTAGFSMQYARTVTVPTEYVVITPSLETRASAVVFSGTISTAKFSVVSSGSSVTTSSTGRPSSYSDAPSFVASAMPCSG